MTHIDSPTINNQQTTQLETRLQTDPPLSLVGPQTLITTSLSPLPVPSTLSSAGPCQLPNSLIMDSSFATLFRSSSFAGLHPKQLVRVLRAPQEKGDAGLKHPVARYKRIHYVQVDAIDNPLTKQADYSNGIHRVHAIRRWKENFPPPATIPEARQWALASFDDPIPSGSSSSRNKSALKPYVENLNPSEWQSLLRGAQSSRKEFAAQVAENKIAPQSYAQFLNVSVSDTGSSYIPSRSVPTVAVHPPVYTVDPSQSQQDKHSKVWGRILNPLTSRYNKNDQHGWAVGISGVVAYLPKSYTPAQSRIYTRDSYDQFTVKLARHDDQGRPEVVVSLKDDYDLGGDAMSASDKWKGLLMSGYGAGLERGEEKEESSPSSSARDSSQGVLEQLSRSWENKGRKKEFVPKKETDKVDMGSLATLLGEGFGSVHKK